MLTVRTPRPWGKGVPREASRSVVCPRCGAQQGRPCRGGRKRKASHPERVREWRRLHPKGRPAPTEPAPDRSAAKARMLAKQQEAHTAYLEERSS